MKDLLTYVEKGGIGRESRGSILILTFGSGGCVEVVK